MLSDLLNVLLAKRGLQTPEAREKFLAPNYARDISDPFLLLGMEKSVAKILETVKSGEKVIVFSDYDADGVPGAVILAEFFRKIKFTNFEVYIPNRHTEKYGLSEKMVREFAENKAKLIITIDCGITDFAEVKLATELGVEVIITDHHLPPSILPPALAVINPKQPGDSYPDKMLCGSGVVFKLVQALSATVRQNFSGFIPEGPYADKNFVAPPLNWEKTLLDLVAIATVSDRVPLRDENRALTAFGLIILRRSRRPGLLALCAGARLDQRYITEDDIGFTIGPRINSAGRMSHASEAYFLLTTNNSAEAQAMATKLEKQNSERKKQVEEILKLAGLKLAESELKPVIALGDESWSAGLLGLAASRLAEKYQKPVFLWGTGGKGSCRSDGTVNLVELMTAAGGQEFFTELGGHVMAAGFSISPERTSELASRLNLAYEKIEKLKPEPVPVSDATLNIDEVGEELWHVVEQLAPFGDGNPKPIFSFPNLEIATAKTFGNGGIHLELGFAQSSGQIIKAIGFFTSLDAFHGVTLAAKEHINLTATLEKSYFRSKPEIRLRIVNIEPAG